MQHPYANEKSLKSSPEPKPCAPFEPLPYRLRIGITGHRDLPQGPQMQGLINQAIETTIWEYYEPRVRKQVETARNTKSPPVQMEIFSALAEGADRLVTKAVLAKGGVLRAVLPLSESDYLDTFLDDESRAEFQRYLIRSTRPLRLRNRDLAQDSPDPARQAELRKDAYEDAGYYIVDHCHVLLALWDGNDSEKQGGTSDIVSYALSEGRPVIRIWDGVAARLNPDARIPAPPLKALRWFNKVTLTQEQCKHRLSRFRRTLFGGDVEARPLTESDCETLERWLFPYYSLSSHLAEHHQSQFFILGTSVYILSALAMACVAIALLRNDVRWYGAELIMLLIIWGTMEWSHRASPNAAWMQCRVLAERLRTTAFLAMCDLEPAPLECQPFMAGAHGLDDWMVHAFVGILDRKPGFTALPGILTLKSHILERWIKAQVAFHRTTAVRHERRHRNIEIVGRVALIMTLVAASMHLGWQSLPEWASSLEWMTGIWTVVAILFPAIAAALVAVQVQREHHRLSIRSEVFAQQTERLQCRLQRAATPGRMRDVLVRIDEQMLREIQDWLMLMRHAEIKGG